MKPARIYQHYVWIVNTLRQHKKLTLAQINELWMKDMVSDGNKLDRNSFRRHTDAILNMFGIIIEHEENTYKYYIANPEVLGDGTMEGWMLSTLTVSAVLTDSLSLRDYILLENVPAGQEFLQTIILAIKTRRRIKIQYQKFGFEAGEKLISPYALKLFHQRWYLLSHTGNHFATYSLDRMLMVQITDEPFEIPDGFKPESYFTEYFGVLTDETPMAHVVVRAYGKTANYLRTLPLHHSQRELQQTDEYTEFSFDIRPTYDFIGQLLSHGDGIEVVSPDDVREKMRQKIVENLKRY
jgi:hypothetical protein